MRHPNVLQIHGAGEHDGRVGIWTEFLQGQSLEQLLIQQGPFGAHEAAVIGMELCRAIAAVHAAGLVHRDIKTSNVVREQGGRLVLLDFGAMDEPSPEGHTRLELGTPITMAPEQLRGGPVLGAADIYGLGVLLYRLVSQHFPIEADSVAELNDRHRRRALVPLRDRRPDLPGEFVRIVERAIDPAPEHRFTSAGEMERALASAAQLPLPGPEPQWRFPWTRGLWITAGVMLAAGLAWIAWQGLIPPSPRSNQAAARAGSATAGSRPAPARAGPSLAATQAIPTPSGAPTSATPAALTATASLFLHRQARAIRLDAGDRIARGDHLFLEFRSDETSHVYVLDQDERGAVFVLFPIAGGDSKSARAEHDPSPARVGGWQELRLAGHERGRARRDPGDRRARADTDPRAGDLALPAGAARRSGQIR